MGKRLLLAGYFGSGNLGDDAILAGFMAGIDGLPFECKAIAGSPERLMRSYGYMSVPKLDQAAIRAAISECDALVFPGGSIFQDVSSVRSVYYYASLVKAAKKAGKKVIMLSQGVGPLNRWLGKRMAAQAFQYADLITVRDPQSVQTLKSLGVQQTPRVTADMAFLLPKPKLPEDSSTFGVAGMKTIGLSARPFGKDRGKAVIQLFGGLVRTLNQNGYAPVMIPMDEVEDRKIVDEIAKMHGGKVPEIKGVTNAAQLQQRIMRIEAVIGMRLHAGILAATVDVPAYMLSYDPKVTAFANAMGYSTPPSMQGLTAQRVFDGFQTFIKDHDRLVTSLAKKRVEMAEAAKGSIEALQTALGA